MPPGAAGPSPCRSARSAPARRKREAREKLLEAARRREIDVVLVWRLDRWGRSVTDLLATLQELEHLGVGFVSLTEALDLRGAPISVTCCVALPFVIFLDFVFLPDLARRRLKSPKPKRPLAVYASGGL